MSGLLKNIRLLRLKKGYSQENVANYLGYNISTWGKIERGDIKLSAENLQKVAELFEMSVDEIIHYNDPAGEVQEPGALYRISSGKDYEMDLVVRLKIKGKDADWLNRVKAGIEQVIEHANQGDNQQGKA